MSNGPEPRSWRNDNFAQTPLLAATCTPHRSTASSPGEEARIPPALVAVAASRGGTGEAAGKRCGGRRLPYILNPDIRINDRSGRSCISGRPEIALLHADKTEATAAARAEGQYRFVATFKGSRTSATLAQTQVVNLPTGFPETNVRTTQANYARSREGVEKRLKAGSIAGGMVDGNRRTPKFQSRQLRLCVAELGNCHSC